MRATSSYRVLIATFICFAGFAQFAYGDRISITTDTPGATVEMDGIVVGKTPYTFDVPGGYLHGAKSVFGKLLRQQMHLRLVLDGYLPVDADLAKGPMQWIALNGTYHGEYWLLKTATFNFTLTKAATTFTGNVQATGPLESVALRPAIPTEEVVRLASPSVVRLRSSESSGSGFLVTDTGVAVTNAHVAKGQTVLSATTSNGQSFNAKVEYVDPSLDLALIKLEGTSFSHLNIADLSSVRAGSSVIAIGTPSGGFQNTVTKGIVSAIGLMPSESGTWIQTDTAINPGNSGGPLLNSAGEVVGITTQKEFFSSDHRPLQGIGFALSSRDLMTVLRRFFPDAVIEVPAVNAPPSSGSGAVLVSSDVEGADIYVDDKFVGNTPSALKLAGGSHRVRVESPNRVAWAREIELSNDSSVNLKATLATAPVDNSPALTKFASQTHPVAVQPPVPATSFQNSPPVITEQRSAMLVSADAVSPRPETQLSSAGTREQQLVPLPEESIWTIKEVQTPGKPAKVTLTSSPAGADIFLDSSGAGKTPLTLEIAPGEHSIQLVLNGYRDQVRKISPRSGYEMVVDAKMLK